MKKLLSLLICLLLLICLCACDAEQALETADAVLDIVAALDEGEEAPSYAAPQDEPAQTEASAPDARIHEDGVYTTKEDVALYLHLYGHLPSNFITKTKAREKAGTAAGWTTFCPGCASAAAASRTARGCSPRGIPIRNATSTRWASPPAGPSA